MSSDITVEAGYYEVTPLADKNTDAVVGSTVGHYTYKTTYEDDVKLVSGKLYVKANSVLTMTFSWVSTTITGVSDTLTVAMGSPAEGTMDPLNGAIVFEAAAFANKVDKTLTITDFVDDVASITVTGSHQA